MPSPPPRSIPTLSKLNLVIDTGRLKLRPWRVDDVEDIWPIVSDPDFPKLMSWYPHKDKQETLEWLEGCVADVAANEEVKWAIEYEGKAIGSIGFHDLTWQLRAFRYDRGELGFWLSPAHQRKGFMTEAAQATVRFGFEEMGLHKIVVRCMAQNIASRRVIEKAAFRWLGRAEEDVWRDGRWHAHLIYELTAPEWPDVHTTLRVQRPKTQS